ncbi:ABC-2 type transport system ATP-binding protein [Alkalicoccobacillus murimartini]|uniref:ABC-2 type transport system ATP-binding protein n=2 Tax=Alkalicoccobacillus murimartini TaxID=171685 RepID=A0ABT9YC67_9BACI|nr:ABC transporter ATP-binding protein [Alkalicoccobacillus murimartini]MDQ0205444.1 ABC-2 type transport system ATP-binding protein [Alkalicoccobacillus murimartini]
MEKMLQLKSVSKTIRGKKIVKDLSFTVNKGEVFGFLGPNGAGKTTAIRMMVGLSSLSSGEILIDGHSIQTSYKKAISQVGGIIENPEMYNHLSAEKNLAHFARMIGKVNEERIDELLRLVGLESVKKKRVGTFSLGMKQRLGIAQALVHNPKILILDEPTNGLDPEGIRTVRDYLKRLAKEQGLAVLVSSHLMSEMKIMCDRFAIIQKGEMVSSEIITSDKNALSKKYRISLQEDQVNDALHLLKAYNKDIESEGEFLFVHLLVEEVPTVIRELANKLNIYEIKEDKETLEDKFLTLTKGKGTQL